MKETIDKIVEIDTLALEHKTQNEQVLSDKRQEYENMISSFHKEKLSDAKQEARKIAEETDVFIKEQEISEKAKIEIISTQIDRLYSKAENDLIKKIFNKLFALEG